MAPKCPRSRDLNIAYAIVIFTPRFTGCFTVPLFDLLPPPSRCLVPCCAYLYVRTGFQVELKEIANPALAYVYDASAETTCSAAGCLGILTRVSHERISIYLG